MRIPLLLVPAVLSCAFAQAADFSPAVQATARQLMQAALHGNKGYAIVESLTTEVGPRLAGTAGVCILGRAARLVGAKRRTHLRQVNQVQQPTGRTAETVVHLGALDLARRGQQPAGPLRAAAQVLGDADHAQRLAIGHQDAEAPCIAQGVAQQSVGGLMLPAGHQHRRHFDRQDAGHGQRRVALAGQGHETRRRAQGVVMPAHHMQRRRQPGQRHRQRPRLVLLCIAGLDDRGPPTHRRR